MINHTPDKYDEETDKPPLLGSWRNIYLLVLANLAVLIVLFYIITRLYE
ncbi:hypothetical protein [Pontibacter sp. SGAir0037]|nr:hypothetical protein [Pontibacter sp. SGAir0037]